MISLLIAFYFSQLFLEISLLNEFSIFLFSPLAIQYADTEKT